MRPMRRQDRAVPEKRAWEILERAEFMTLSMQGADGTPYGVTLSFAREGEGLVFHCAAQGYKVDSLRQNPAICVTAVAAQRTRPEEFTVAFESAVAFGTAREVTEPEEKRRALLALCRKYAPETAGAAAYMEQYPGVAVWRVEVSGITGKQHL